MWDKKNMDSAYRLYRASFGDVKAVRELSKIVGIKNLEKKIQYPDANQSDYKKHYYNRRRGR